MNRFKTEILHYSALNKDEFHDMIALRMAVFVVEQNCPYQELDGKDKDAFHVLMTDNEQIIGTTRILKPGTVYAEPAIGRVVSHPDYRNKGVGHQLMEKAMDFLEKEFGERAARLSAQTHLVGFYKHHGFISTGKTYLEDNIPHTEMVYEKNTH